MFPSLKLITARFILGWYRDFWVDGTLEYLVDECAEIIEKEEFKAIECLLKKKDVFFHPKFLGPVPELHLLEGTEYKTVDLHFFWWEDWWIAHDKGKMVILIIEIGHPSEIVRRLSIETTVCFGNTYDRLEFYVNGVGHILRRCDYLDITPGREIHGVRKPRWGLYYNIHSRTVMGKSG